MTASITVLPFSPAKNPDNRKNKQLATSMNHVLFTLHMVENLALLSKSVVIAAHKGESYEVLTRQLETLHQNFQEVAQLASQTKYCTIAPKNH